MKKKLTIAIHKFMDVEACEMPKGFPEKLRKEKLYTYKDTEPSLKEHLYDIETLKEKNLQEPHFLNTLEKEALKTIIKNCDKYDVGYFRFVYN